MSAEGRRSLRAVLSLALLAIGILLTLPLNKGILRPGPAVTSPTLFDNPEFSIRFGRNQLRLAGTTASPEHERALAQLVEEQFADARAQTSFRPALTLQPGWETRTTRLLYAVAATQSAEARIGPDGISIRGTTTDRSSFRSRLQFLQSALPEGSVVEADIIAVDDIRQIDALCVRSFSSLAGEPINFRQASIAIRTSSFALLDRLAEFSYECPAHKIAITGHTDATGSDTWNIKVSRDRAQAVADQLVARGVPAERLIVDGLGASLPIADNETVPGRERNRRIEIGLR
jgi:outer membrane protein OmpA-like peptidoglycan-associated protein